ncbi:MAG TPA: TIGR01777 family oxidoreductase [Vicinamibacterales bacterium]|jgi:hypothetical protein
MKIIVAGGTGLLGGPLCATLAAEGHHVVVLTRQATPAAPDRADVVRWRPDGGVGDWASGLHDADAVINLTGESLAGGRWTAARKQRLRDSRLLPTRSLVAAIRSSARPPDVLLNASAIGYYGDRGDELVTESTPAGDDFAARLCVDWEVEATAAASDSTRVALIRTAPVLARDGGLLAQMALPFKLFVGGPMGSGHQYLPWIHLDDWVRLVQWMLESDVTGAVNACAPAPVTNAAFSRALGGALGRPSWLRAPAPAIRLALGEMATMVLAGQRAMPAKAIERDVPFKYGNLDEALRSIYR